MMPCNPPEYVQYIEGAGYAKVMDLYAWLFDLRQPLPDRFTRLVAQSELRGEFVVRPVDFSDFPPTGALCRPRTRSSSTSPPI